MSEKYLKLQNCIDDAYTFLGAHKCEQGYNFSVYAPNAGSVCLIGSFNNWKEQKMTKRENGVWELTVKASQYDRYKFVLRCGRKKFYKADPFAFFSQTRGQTNSVLFESEYHWQDQEYLASRCAPYNQPMNIYEVHLGSWKDKPNGEKADYPYLAQTLVPYVKQMGYNYVEFLPIMEHPLDDSWGYQVTGYYSPTSRYGNPDQLRQLIDAFHKEDIGVILDWVPAHFCKDDFGLIEFDGSFLYESEKPTRREHEEWGTRIFDTSKPYVCSFLLSNANYWLKEFHFDGLRVDAVASMLYLDYAKKDGEWEPNVNGGKENLENVEFFRILSRSVFGNFPNALLIAEESTAFPSVTAPADQGGLGFSFKWNMGWMNDTLSYFCTDFNKRQYVHNKLTFPIMYAYTENYILPLSHDEVVHGKYSLLSKQPGNYEQKFNGLKTLTAFQYAFTGKKLTFMGNEIAQFIEWNFRNQLDWLLLDFPAHKQYNDFARQLNQVYLANTALYERDLSPNGFTYLVADDTSGILAFLRHSDSQTLLCLFNFSTAPRNRYSINIPQGSWKSLFSTNGKKLSVNVTEQATLLSIDALSAYYLVKEDFSN